MSNVTAGKDNVVEENKAKFGILADKVKTLKEQISMITRFMRKPEWVSNTVPENSSLVEENKAKIVIL